MEWPLQATLSGFLCRGIAGVQTVASSTLTSRCSLAQSFTVPVGFRLVALAWASESIRESFTTPTLSDSVVQFLDNRSTARERLEIATLRQTEQGGVVARHVVGKFSGSVPQRRRDNFAEVRKRQVRFSFPFLLVS